MAGIGGIDRGRALGACAALLLVAIPVPPTVAAEAPSAQLLPGFVVGAITVDLDGDASRELVRLVSESDTRLLLEAWRFSGEAWVLVDSQPVPRRSVDAPVVVPSPPAGALLPWTRDGQPSALLLTAEQDTSSQFGALCCLAASMLSLEDGRLALSPMPFDVDRAPELFEPADIDGDGTDELLTVHTDYEDPTDHGTTWFEIVRWDGDAWTPAFEMSMESHGYGFATGETDGVPGADVLIGAIDGGLLRVAWMDGEVTTEAAEIAGDLGRSGWISGIANGDIVMSASDGAHVVRWPRGGPPDVVASVEAGEFPSVQLVGDGPDAIIMMMPTPDFGASVNGVEIRDLRFRRLGHVEFGPAVTSAWELGQSAGGLWSESGRFLFPYVGPMPDLDAYVAGGTLVRPDAGGYAVEPIGSMIGTQPIGLAGPGGSWVVLGGGFNPYPGGAYFLHVAHRFGAPGPMAIVPLDDLLRNDAPDLAGSIELHGAVEVERDGDEGTLVADGGGFTIAVTALTGTWVALVDQSTRTWEVGDGPLEIPVRPPNLRDDANIPFERTLLVMSPNGHASVVRWEGTFIHHPPELTAGAETSLLRPHAAIAGHATPGSTVTVDGHEVHTWISGRFESEVDAPIWPRDVVVTARDALGNETTQRVEVIGFVDYRGLPWLPIVAVMTVTAGLLMFVRTPRHRALRLAVDGDGRLEEIDGDRP